MLIPRVCIAVDKNARASDVVRMAFYHCKASGKRLCTNRTAIPYSPYTGKFMERIGTQSTRVPVREIRADLINVGSCPACDDQLYVWPSTAKTLKGKKIHCVVCKTQFPVRISAEDVSTIDAINEHNEENQARKLTHDNVDEDAADASLIHANADDDDDDGELGDGDDDNDSTDRDDVSSEADDADDDDDDDENDGEENDGDEGAEDNTGDDDDDGENDDTDNSPENQPADTNAKITAPGGATPDASNPVPQPLSKPAEDKSGDVSNTDQLESHKPEGEGEEGEGDDDKMDTSDEMADDVVSAAAKEFVINCLSRAGNLAGRSISYAMLTPRVAIIAVDGDPVVKLEADKAGDNEKLFAEPENLARAIDAIIAACESKKDYSGNPFAALGGAPITFRIPVSEEVQARITSGITAVTASTTAGQSAVLDDVKQCLSIAGLIMARNADKELVNPLREKLVKVLSAVNVQNADTIVDDAMEESGEPFVTALLTKTRELLEKPATARNEIAKFVERTPHRKSGGDKSKSHRQQFAQSSVNLSTAAADDGVKLPERIAPVVASEVAGGSVEHYRGLLRGMR